jgi:hypothetical protein
MYDASIQALTKPNEIRLTIPGKKWLTGASTPKCRGVIGILFPQIWYIFSGGIKSVRFVLSGFRKLNSASRVRASLVSESDGDLRATATDLGPQMPWCVKLGIRDRTFILRRLYCD